MGLDNRLRKLERVIGFMDLLESRVSDIEGRLRELEDEEDTDDDRPLSETDPELSALWDEAADRLDAQRVDSRLAGIPILNPNWEAEVAAARAATVGPRAAVPVPGPYAGDLPGPYAGGLPDFLTPAAALAALPESERVAMQEWLAAKTAAIDAAGPEPQDDAAVG